MEKKKYKENTNLFLQNRGFQPSFSRFSLSPEQYVGVQPGTENINSIQLVLSWFDFLHTLKTFFHSDTSKQC